ncbi:monocarboxylate transporter 4-like isoform X2 [Ruditapes philippinarum]|uniref:monocarboxylate transporter 4-like isoform X2 n=1 Tax=Ruditapes philippinarum TaxID=129788 RepID=UPI00295A6129|nr:monocarboxylate transporter 4-like isoform X2 [Ruditapes philippinarum]
MITKQGEIMVRQILLVIACHLVHMLSCGISLSFGVLYREMRIEFGTNFTEAAWIASIFNGLLGFVGMPLSFIVNRLGERWPTVFGSLLLVVGMLTSMFATGIRTVYITYGLTAGLGAGINHYCAYTVIPPHFNKRWRPVAVMLASAGVPMATLVLPPILTVIIEAYDWRKAYMFLACLSLLGLPAALIFYKQDVSKCVESESKNATNSGTLRASRFWKDSSYILYLTSTVLIYLMLFVPSTFLPDLMHEFGRSSQDVYISLMAMGVGDLSARLLFGFLVQKIPRKLAFIRSAGAMLSCVASCLITRSRSLLMFAIFSGLIGVSIGICSGLAFYMAVHLLAAKDVRVGYGLVLTLGGFAFVAGIPIAGIKERCGKTSSMTYEVQSEVNRGYIDKEDIQTDGEANKSASLEQCSHL